MLDKDLGEFNFDLDADRGKLTVHVQVVGRVMLSPKEVVLCQQFQVKLFNLLLKRNLDKPLEDDQHSKTNGTLDGVRGNTYLTSRDGESITYKEYYQMRHGISLKDEQESFLKGKKIFTVHNYLQQCRTPNKKELTYSSCELPPNLGESFLIKSRSIFKGFIQNEPFDLKTWMIPGIDCGETVLEEHEISASKKVYSGGSRHIKIKTVVDVVKALIGAFLSAAGEMAALSFMVWLGIEINFATVPYMRMFVTNPEMHVNIEYFESLLRYSFRDASLLVEALTLGSYMRPEIPGCYQRLEFLGDAGLNYLITVHHIKTEIVISSCKIRYNFSSMVIFHRLLKIWTRPVDLATRELHMFSV